MVTTWNPILWRSRTSWHSAAVDINRCDKINMKKNNNKWDSLVLSQETYRMFFSLYLIQSVK